MSARLAISLWTILPLAALTSPVVAQRHKTVFLGAAVARPTDAFASEVDPGWQVSGTLDIPLGAQVTSLRIELAYARFGSSLAGQAPSMIPAVGDSRRRVPG